MPSSLLAIFLKANSLQASSLKANSLKANSLKANSLNVMRAGFALNIVLLSLATVAFADAACPPDRIAGLFRDGVQGSSRPQGGLRRSADPRLWRHGGEYRLLHVFLCQGRRDQEPARALQLHLRQERRELAHRRPSFLGDATAPEIANSPREATGAHIRATRWFIRATLAQAISR